MTASGGSVLERFSAFPRGAQEMSAARLARDVVAAVDRAFRARGKTQRALAADLGLSEGAVSQVLNGDGNLRIATLARYLRALGYEARFSLEPVESDTPAVSLSGRPRRRPVSAPRTPSVPGTHSDSWTVINSGGELFGVHVSYHASATPGMRSFSGECNVPIPFAPAKVATKSSFTSAAGLFSNRAPISVTAE
ncbi:MAG: helix-turn-helix protein [Frankiales bacterium]|nr:helix-turn-helix protein [Frankiales bacterium]